LHLTSFYLLLEMLSRHEIIITVINDHERNNRFMGYIYANSLEASTTGMSNSKFEFHFDKQTLICTKLFKKK